MSEITLSGARTIIAAALVEARARGVKPLAVAVVDAGGHLVAFEREDDASFLRFDIARAKALGSLGMGESSRALAEKAKGNPVFFQSVTAVAGGQIAFSPGGLLVRSGGRVIGAIGISGDTGDCDEACARVGLAAAGFEMETVA